MNDSGRMLMHSASDCHKGWYVMLPSAGKENMWVAPLPPPGQHRCTCRVAPLESCVFKVARLSGPQRTTPQDLTSLIFSRGSCQNFRVLVIARGVSQGCFKFFPCLEKTLLHNGCGEMYRGLERVGRCANLLTEWRQSIRNTERVVFSTRGN